MKLRVLYFAAFRERVGRAEESVDAPSSVANVAQLRDNLAATDVKLSAEQIARLDNASAVRPAYPYWHQRRTSLARNPPPVA